MSQITAPIRVTHHALIRLRERSRHHRSMSYAQLESAIIAMAEVGDPEKNFSANCWDIKCQCPDSGAKLTLVSKLQHDGQIVIKTVITERQRRQCRNHKPRRYGR